MENNNQNQKEGFNKLLILIPIVVILGIGAFFAFKFLMPKDVGEFELRAKGRYANFIKDAKTKYETRNGRNVEYIYENVIYEAVSSRREVIESRDDVAMASYIVTLIPKDNSGVVNYQCDILKSEFTREVENMIKNRDTSFIKDAVAAADAINSVRLKGEDIPLDLEVGDIELGASAGLGAIKGNAKLGKIGLKTDIGKIANLVGDVGIGAAAGVEQTLNNLLKDKKVKADEFVANLDDVTYYSLMLSFAKKMYVEVSDPLIEEDVIRKLDDIGRKQYQMLKEKYLNGNVEVVINNNIQEDTKKNKYEEKLKELGIKKIIKKGFNSSSITNAGIGYSRFSIPTYYIADERNEILDDKKWYIVRDNNRAVLCLIRIDDEYAGNSVSEYRTALSSGKIKENIEGIIQNQFNDNTVEVFDYEDVKVNNQMWNKFKLLSNDNYYEVVEFLDVNTEQTSKKINDKYVFMILKEPIRDEFEYNEDFSKIIESIKKIETVKLGRDLEDIKKMGFIDAKEYLEERGFYNFDIYYMKESDGLFGLGAKKNNEIDEITINNNSKLKSNDNVRQDAKIIISYYNTAEYNRAKEQNKKINEYLEKRNRENEEIQKNDEEAITAQENSNDEFDEVENLNRENEKKAENGEIPINNGNIILGFMERNGIYPYKEFEYKTIAMITEKGLIPTQLGKEVGIKNGDIIELIDGRFKFSHELVGSLYGGLSFVFIPEKGTIDIKVYRPKTNEYLDFNINNSDYENINEEPLYLLGVSFDLLEEDGLYTIYVSEIKNQDISNLFGIELNDYIVKFDKMDKDVISMWLKEILKEYKQDKGIDTHSILDALTTSLEIYPLTMKKPNTNDEYIITWEDVLNISLSVE